MKSRLACGSPPRTERVAMTSPANPTTIEVKKRVRSISWRWSVSRGVTTDVMREPVEALDGSSLRRPLERSAFL